MSFFREVLKALPLGLGVPLMIGAASVSPKDAALNLLKWASALGIQDLPPWLSQAATDRRVIYAALAAAPIYAFLVWGLPVLRRRKSRSIKNAAPQTRVRIVLGTGHPFETIAPAGINRRRTLRVMIENNTDTEITNGRLEALHLDPPHRGNKDWLLKPDIVIGAHKSTLVDVASYDEGSSKALPGTWMQLVVPPGGAFFAEAIPLLPLKPHSFQLKFSCLQYGLFDEVHCRLFVGTDRILHLENQIAPSSNRVLVEPTWITLFEAATRAYEALQHHDSVIPMEAFSDSPDEILTNVCEMLCRAQNTTEPLVKLHGTKPPSRIREEIYIAPLNKYMFVVEGKSIVLVGHNGTVRYENLVADQEQVEAAIVDIKKRHEA